MVDVSVLLSWRKVLQVRPDTTAKNLIVYCRDCRTETMVDIEQGQCFESQCR
ncbi:MAG: cysteine-rich KTR domain-containing protein [Flavonifractor plautii]